MNIKIAAVAIAVATIFSVDANAHGCSGQGACAQHHNTTQNNPHQSQSQGQSLTNQSPQTLNASIGAPHQAANSHGGSVVNHTGGSRYLSVRPVHVDAPAIVAPSAGVSRMVSAECGPRMRRAVADVRGINNRPTAREDLVVGREDNLLPDYKEPYRKVQLTPHVYQLIGHRLIETTTVVTTSTGGGFGFSLMGNSGGGGSLGAQTGGAIQQLITTIRLQECVAFEVDTRPLKPRG